jgi:hypothetical protein
MSEDLLSPTFAQHLNTKFRARVSDSRESEFELISVENRPSPPRGYECFSLLFRAPGDTPVEQRLYKLEHDHLPDIDVFLVPVRNEQNGIVFEAVFNRLLEANP